LGEKGGREKHKKEGLCKGSWKWQQKKNEEVIKRARRGQQCKMIRGRVLGKMGE